MSLFQNQADTFYLFIHPLFERLALLKHGNIPCLEVFFLHVAHLSHQIKEILCVHKSKKALFYDYSFRRLNFTQAFTAEPHFLDVEIILVYLGGVEVKPHFIGGYTA